MLKFNIKKGRLNIMDETHMVIIKGAYNYTAGFIWDSMLKDCTLDIKEGDKFNTTYCLYNHSLFRFKIPIRSKNDLKDILYVTVSIKDGEYHIVRHGAVGNLYTYLINSKNA